MPRDEVTAGLVHKLWGAIDPQRRQMLELTDAEETQLYRLSADRRSATVVDGKG